MKRKRTVIGISVAAVLAVCAVVLAVVFGVRSAKPHVHEYDFSALSWEWEESGSARASASCACGEKLALQAEISQTTLVPATCEETGKALFTAKINSNGMEYTDAREFDLPALGHEYDYSAVIWSWEEDGTATANAPCKRGGHTLTLTPEIEEEILVEPTCDSEGSARYTARIANGGTDTYLRKLSALGHDYQAEFIWETDRSAATLHLTCKRGCGAAHSERIEAELSHTEPTCEHNGSDTYTVRTVYEGKTYDEAFVKNIPANNHDYDYTAVEWLWQDRTAKAVVRCRRDKNHTLQCETEVSEEIIKQPACEEAGEGRYTARFEREGMEFSDERVLPIPALGHDYDFESAVWQWEGTESATATVSCARDPFHHLKVLSAEIAVTDEVKATCTKAGYKKYTATVTDGGKEYTDAKWAEIPKGEHVFEAAEFWDNGSHELICKECGHSELAAHENGEDGICTLCGMSTWLYYTVINADGSAASVSPFAFADSAYKKVVIPSRYFNGGVMAEVEYLVFKNSPTIESVVISEGIDEISDHAFYGCSSLKEVTCPDVVRISDHAFAECKSLTEFVCPKGVTALASAAFQNCTALTKVTLPNGLQQIYDEVFSGCSALSEIELPQTVTLIDNMAFYQCSSLTQINLPKENIAMSVPTGLHTIGVGAFAGCSITELTIPSSVTSIGSGAFTECSDLKSVVFLGELERLEDLIFGLCTELTEITLPRGLKQIGETAFAFCISLTNIVLPSGLESIGEQAFAGCYALREVVIPKSVTHIGANAFEGARRVVIYCEAASKPQGWEDGWNNDRPVYWAYEEDLVNG